jgi:hypothetical protein
VRKQARKKCDRESAKEDGKKIEEAAKSFGNSYFLRVFLRALCAFAVEFVFRWRAIAQGHSS